MPCWIGKGCGMEVVRPICVFHFGHADVMWEARCLKAAPCQHIHALQSALEAFSVLPKTAVYQYGFFSGSLSLVVWWNTILQWEWSWISTTVAGQKASGITLLPWTPAQSCGDTRGFPHVGLADGLLPWWGVKSRSLPGFGFIWVNGVTVVINTPMQCPDTGVAVVW